MQITPISIVYLFSTWIGILASMNFFDFVYYKLVTIPYIQIFWPSGLNHLNMCTIYVLNLFLRNTKTIAETVPLVSEINYQIELKLLEGLQDQILAFIVPILHLWNMNLNVLFFFNLLLHEGFCSIYLIDWAHLVCCHVMIFILPTLPIYKDDFWHKCLNYYHWMP